MRFIFALFLVFLVPNIMGFRMNSKLVKLRLSTGQRNKDFISTFRQSLSMKDDSSDNNITVIGATGIFSNIVVDYSLYTLKTTGCGLPPGPFGLEGGIEGISYLTIIGIAAWSTITKIKTGTGLPAGPNGLLGAAEGLSYLSILVGIVIAVLNYFDYGFLPGFIPDDKCYGS